MGEEISEINSYKSIESSNQDRTDESGKEKVIVWSNEQLLYWRRIDEEYVAEPSLTAFRQEIERQRQYAQKEMLQLLNAFLTSEITLEVFNRIFQQKTNGTWNAFHVRGTSGGMFLNKLVKYIPEENHLAQLLRVVLRLPKDTKEGHWRMQIFVQFLEDVIASQQAARIQLQPARVPFFLSVWWHLQETEQWPISYLTVRNVILGEEREPEIEQDPIERYFVLRVPAEIKVPTTWVE